MKVGITLHIPASSFKELACAASDSGVTTKEYLEGKLLGEIARKQNVFLFYIHFCMQYYNEPLLIRTFEARLLYRNGIASYGSWSFKTCCFPGNTTWGYFGAENNTFAQDSDVRGIIRFLRWDKEFTQIVSTHCNLEVEVTRSPKRKLQYKIISATKI